MGLFDKKYCDVCGAKIGFLGNRKLEDGNLCKDCAKKLSPWFSERRNSTVSEIKEQLAYREKNRERAAQFRTTRSYGEDCKVLLDEEHRWFTVTRARDLAGANPDILDCTALTGCRVDIDESRTEQKREGPDGKEVSYNPPRYDLDYDFNLTIHVNTPYFTEINLRVNDSTIDQRGSIEYREAKRQATEVRDALVQLRQETRDSVVAAKAPKTAVTCPFCGATTIPDASGRCEYCGGAIGA